MATKHTSICLRNASDDEPIFVLRAQDKNAAQVIKYWVYLSDLDGTPKAKLDQALKVAEAMLRWKVHKVPD